MKIVITGGGGFLGRRLAQALLQRSALRNDRGELESLDTLVLFDAVPAALPDASDTRVQAATGDITDPAQLARVIDDHTTSVFHFAAVVSAAAEGNASMDEIIQSFIEDDLPSAQG